MVEHVCTCQPRQATYTTAPLDQPFPVPEYAPRSWFDRPDWLQPGQKLTVTDEGQVAGYWYPAGHCLINSHSDCPQPSLTGYDAFHQQDVVTDDGETVRVGAIGNTHGHADPNGSIGAAAKHYADPSAQLMVVRAGDDDYGGWIAGALVPGVTYGDVALLRRSGLSGDWRQFPRQWWEAHGTDWAEVKRVESFDAIGPTLVTRPGLPLVERFGSVMLGGMAGVQLEGAPVPRTGTTAEKMETVRESLQAAPPPPTPAADTAAQPDMMAEYDQRLSALESAVAEIAGWINEQMSAQAASIAAGVVPLPEDYDTWTWDAWLAATKTEDGKAFPASDYAYVPDPNTPSTWKLRLTATPGGAPDPAIVGAAAAALSPGGFRGQQAAIPAADRPRVVAKVRAAWRAANPDKAPDEMPKSIAP